jgi:hypothetical protein
VGRKTEAKVMQKRSKAIAETHARQNPTWHTVDVSELAASAKKRPGAR